MASTRPPSRLAPLLPATPAIAIGVARDHTEEARATGGFLNLRRVELYARYPDGETSRPFSYDVATRAGIDASIMLAYRIERGERIVYLRSAVRAPLALRDGLAPIDYNLWEIPAGIIDPGETPEETAVRELDEELGFRVKEAHLEALGGWTWPSSGIIAERHYFFALDVTGMPRSTPSEDGSPLERGAEILERPLGELLDACRRGELRDAKTELALRRFAERP